MIQIKVGKTKVEANPGDPSSKAALILVGQATVMRTEDGTYWLSLKSEGEAGQFERIGMEIPGPLFTQVAIDQVRRPAPKPSEQA